MKLNGHLTPSYVSVTDTIHVFAVGNPQVSMSSVAELTRVIIGLLDQPPTCVSTLRIATLNGSNATGGGQDGQSTIVSA